MNVIKKLFYFICNGLSVFCEASHGRYLSSSKGMEQLRSQMLKKSSPLDDRINLNNDLRNIYGDIHVSYQKLTLKHG